MPYCAHCGRAVEASTVTCPACGKPPFGPAPGAVKSDASKATWIVVLGGCLVLCVLVGLILAAILIPNFLTARERARQARTLADLRNMGAALEAYWSDQGVFPEAESMEDLAQILEPTYIDELPRTDGWANPYRYTCWSESSGTAGCDTYRLASAGRDGAFEHQDLQVYEVEETEPGDYDRDLVLGDGFFLQYPGGRR